jgi:hypothetical protein
MNMTANEQQQFRATSVMLLSGAVLFCALILQLAHQVRGGPQLVAIFAGCGGTVASVYLAVRFILRGNVDGRRRPDWEWCCVLLGLGACWLAMQLFWELLQLA